MNLNELELLPRKTGIYKFYNKKGEILYIGKALNLQARVKSYFNNTLYDRPYVKKMIPFINRIEVEETNNEVESLVLEAALIKEYQPKYNSELKDGKSYAWIYIPIKEKFPTVKVVRNINEKELKKGKLFGPYPNIHSARRVFTYLRKIYPFCTCSPSKAKREGVCMYYHLGLCPGPYQNHISETEYKENIKEIIKFLEGKKKGHISNLEKEMKKYAKAKEYEKAGELRDKINDLKYLSQKIDFEYEETPDSYIQKRKELLKSNFKELKIELGLKALNRIECYDVSNIQGKEAYTSLVVAEEGEIKRSEYRIFKIKTLNKPNDMHMLKEALERRFHPKNLIKYPSIPEVVLIDGGKPQLSVVQKVIPKEICLLGITEGEKKGSRILDEFWYVDRESRKISRIDIENKSLLIDLRDEAHRFAILHHRKARRKKSQSSQLDNILGVGQKSRKKLLKAFESIENIKKASFEELNEVLNNKRISESVFKYFRKQ